MLRLVEKQFWLLRSTNRMAACRGGSPRNTSISLRCWC